MTLRVAVDPLNVVLRKATPDVAEKLTLLIATKEPLKVTFTGTFWGVTSPPVCALNVTVLGFATTVLLPPLLPTLKLTVSWVDWAPLA